MPRYTVSTLSPCDNATETVFRENKRSAGLRGGRCMTSASASSASSASKMMEQDGSMINSRNTMCTGISNSGQLGKKIGAIDNPAIGTWTARMNVTAFLMLSYI